MLDYYCCCEQHSMAEEFKVIRSTSLLHVTTMTQQKCSRVHDEFNGGLPVMFTQGLCSAKLSMTNVPPRFITDETMESTSSSNSADSTCRR